MARRYIAGNLSIAFFLAGLLMLVSGCSTKRNTFVTRTFHNITSRFNGYFYANESVKEGVTRLEKGHKDDFTKIIPVFIYPTPDEAKGLFPDMDKSIKKLSLVIHRHTITNRAKKEIPGACRWIDDCYLLMGRSHFYKRDFFSAIESFDYVAKTYKILPNRFMGMMWLIRTYDELGSVSEAESIIDLLAEEKKLPKEYKTELAAIEAYHFILRENYGGAIKPLHLAIAGTKKKKLRARYMFIEAQIEQKLGKNKHAEALYSEVIKLHPGYELTFNSQINRARCYDVSLAGAGMNIKKELQKMLKDAKNAENFDQIFYTLAEIAEKEGDTPMCISYLKKSVTASVANTNQKAMSFLKLADLSFANADYKPAQAYYDSTVALIKNDFPNYEMIVNKKTSLSELVKNLNQIVIEDSLQQMAKMDPKERDKKIEKIIKQQAEEEERKKAEALLVQQQAQQVTQLIPQSPTPQNGGQWYFYNPTTVNYGKSEFKKKWGDRKLEDNWRRSSKEIVLEENAALDEQHADTLKASSDSIAKKTAAKVTDKKSKEYFLQNLPLTDDAIKKSNEKIVDAYYNLGSIYKEQLNNNPKSAESFEELMQRFPDNKYKLPACYQLYRLYMAMDNNTKADVYKNIFLTKYPETEYAKIIANPDYNKQKQADVSEAEKLYTEAYRLYSDSDYTGTILKCQIADTALGKNPLMSKFDLLEAMAIGRTQGVAAFETALTRIIIKYPKDDVKNKAQEYIDLIKKSKTGTSLSEAKKDSLFNNAAQYLYNKDAEYFWVLVYDGPVDANKIKIELSNINSEYYSLENLNIESILFESNKQMITVKSFTGHDKAMTYYNLITKDKKSIFSSLDPAKLKIFVISAENFPVFYKAKNIAGYMSFFQGNFLK